MSFRLRELGAVLGILAFCGTPAFAQDDPAAQAEAQTLFDQAIDEMEAKQYASACRKLEIVTKRVPRAIGAKEQLAACYEAEGRSASAWAQYAQAEALAATTGDRARADKDARNAERLKGRLASIRLDVPKEVASIEGLSIALDGRVQERVTWGLELPVDATEHEVEVNAPNRARWSTKVVVEADGKKSVVTIEPPAPLQAAPPPPSEPKGPTTTPLPIETGDAKSKSGLSKPTWPRKAGFGALGLGAIGLGAGAALGAVALVRNAESDDGHCDGRNHCDPTGYDLRMQARAFGNGSTAAFVTGGVLAAGGLTLLWLYPASPRGKEGNTNRVQASFEIGPSGIAVRGAF